MIPWLNQRLHLRISQIKKDRNSKLLDLTGACKVTIDYDKYNINRYEYLTGLNNYTLFQKFSSFRWPAWINAITDPSRGSVNLAPFMLVNSIMRDSLYFTNFLSDNGLHIDPAGMMSPTYGHWSIETWIVSGNDLFRPADDWARIRQERDTKNSLIYSTWENALCKLRHTLYGARSAVDEVVVETECLLKERKNSSIMFVVRPYDLQQLGGCDSIEYQKEGAALVINGGKSVCFSARPDYVSPGGGDGCRDIDLSGGDRGIRSNSPFGMATLGIGYALKKGENRFTFRIAIEKRGNLATGKYNYAGVKEDYTAFSGMRIKTGANFTAPDKQLQNWFYGSKISLLNFSLGQIRRDNGTMDCRKAFYIIFGCNRMGYFAESARYLEHLIKNAPSDEKKPAFDAVIDTCALIVSIADYFIHVRDTAFIQDRFEFIKKKALEIYGFSRRLKKPGALSRNSLAHYSIAEEHPFDYILIAHSLGHYSYLARCLGIFGEELKFKKESDRIAGIMLKSAFDEDPGRPENEFIMYNLFAGFPFRIDAVSDSMLNALFKRMGSYFTGMPLFVKSLGYDIMSTLVAANNMIQMKDPKVYDGIMDLLKMRGRTYVLPEFMNPTTGRSNWGDGVSMAASAMVFATIRNLLFIDRPERLDLFPLPRAEWFEPGNEMKIEDVPSRFGLISLRTVSTVNEVQIHFEKLPKFVPPDILINMPYKTKIKLEDDFVLKRENETSFIINGWPSIVRLIRA
jgi:hypothetical protein